MALRPARICICGKVVAYGATCPCRQRERAEADARRPTAAQRGYGSKWQQARADFLIGKRCARPGCTSIATIVDHVEPHRGDHKLFWNRNNWQPLCKPCHDRWKQSQEKRTP